jgi:uncharacterized protein (DUF2249 family)
MVIRWASEFRGLFEGLSGSPIGTTGAVMCQTTEETGVAEIDFRNLNQAQRHTKAFQIVGDLRAGESFVLVNDHDPKPLYDQLQSRHPDAFSWIYLQQGPSVWKVEIAMQFKVA